MLCRLYSCDRGEKLSSVDSLGFSLLVIWMFGMQLYSNNALCPLLSIMNANHFVIGKNQTIGIVLCSLLFSWRKQKGFFCLPNLNLYSFNLQVMMLKIPMTATSQVMINGAPPIAYPLMAQGLVLPLRSIAKN